LRTWIFQGNPEIFDIDGYLSKAVQEISWRVARYADEIGVGDAVYIWKSQGGDKENAGIIAECEVVEQPRSQLEDPIALPFWKDHEELGEAVRTWLKLIRVANKKEVLKREWLRDDSVLQNLLILRQAAGTNFPVSEAESRRLKVLWSKVGQDWSRDEVVAALHLYAGLGEKPISRTIGSPVERLSQQIGRVPTGVYNKLMNLRALDPRVDQKGLAGGSKTDREVWAEFFDGAANAPDERRLDQEYPRLWQAVETAQATEPRLEEEVHRLSQKPLEQLMEAYGNRRVSEKPIRKEAQQLVYERSTLVITITRKRAGYSCEVEGCSSPTFVTDDGERFVEVHHLTPLAQGGEDTIENNACLCPTHHREIHHGKLRHLLTASLRARSARRA
jgi:predicted HNH restriction endonuclease